MRRPDKFIIKHIPYLEGVMKLAIANLKFPVSNKNSSGDYDIIQEKSTSEQIKSQRKIASIPSSNNNDPFQDLEFEEVQDPEENWMGKNESAVSQSIVTLQQSKPTQRRSKYSILNAQNINLCEPVPVLRNGFVGGGLETVNTCAFDCIFSTFACLYQDYSKFRTLMDTHQNDSQFCAFVAKTLKAKNVLKKAKNVSKKVYIERNKILYDLAGYSGKITQLTRLNCETGFGGVFSAICKKNEFLASSILKRTCDECEYASRVVRSFLPLLVQDIDIRDLQTNVVDSTKQDEFCPECKDICIAEHHFNPVLALEVEPISEKAKQEFKVQDMTSRILVNNKSYYLCGVIEGRQSHFVCHMLRKNAIWETFDDLKTEVSTLDLSKEIKVFMLFYICFGKCDFSQNNVYYLTLKL